jgi:AraC-like DNA-binding protein
LINEGYPKAYLYRRIVQSKLFIDHHYSEPLNLDQIAQEAYFSRFHFIRLFRKAYGRTPHQYLIFVRIEHAKRLLSLNHAVSEVCHQVGFESPGSFTGLFKREVKQTPSAYQRLKQFMSADMAEYPLKYIPNCFVEMNGWAGTHKQFAIT